MTSIVNVFMLSIEKKKKIKGHFKAASLFDKQDCLLPLNN